MGTVTILPETTKNPITLIGKRAGICWNTDITDDEKNYQRGIDCIKSNHGRVLEFVNIEAVIEGFSARVIREWYTHIGGAPTRLQSSTRYIDYNDFDFIIPNESITDNEVTMTDAQIEIYKNTMSQIKQSAKQLKKSGMPKQDIAMLLPLGMTTTIVDKRNVRNVIDMSGQRMCKRAYWEFRDLFFEYISKLKEYSDEWITLIDLTMKPKCERLGYCPEKNSCKRKPKKNA